jgi:hypothetical protein
MREIRDAGVEFQAQLGEALVNFGAQGFDLVSFWSMASIRLSTPLIWR